MTTIQLDTIVCPRCHELVAEWGLDEHQRWNTLTDNMRDEDRGVDHLYIECPSCNVVITVPFLRDANPYIEETHQLQIEVVYE
jgi:phage FluMu protein Com